jgi:hypothetical protein
VLLPIGSAARHAAYQLISGCVCISFGQYEFARANMLAKMGYVALGKLAFRRLKAQFMWTNQT